MIQVRITFDLRNMLNFYLIIFLFSFKILSIIKILFEYDKNDDEMENIVYYNVVYCLPMKGI